MYVLWLCSGGSVYYLPHTMGEHGGRVNHLAPTMHRGPAPRGGPAAPRRTVLLRTHRYVGAAVRYKILLIRFMDNSTPVFVGPD